MAHHLAGASNSAKRRQAMAEEMHDAQPEQAGFLSSLTKAGNDTFSAMQSRFGNLCSTSKEKALQLEHAVEERIQHRPIVSMLAVLGIGVLLGSICTMACKRK